MTIQKIKRIIEVKEKKREEKERELKEVMELVRVVESELMAIRKEYIENQSQFLVGLIDGIDFHVLRDYLFCLESKIKELDEKKSSLDGRLSKLREEILCLHKEIKKLEKLKEKATLAQKKKDHTRIQKKIDELALRLAGNFFHPEN